MCKLFEVASPLPLCLLVPMEFLTKQGDPVTFSFDYVDVEYLTRTFKLVEKENKQYQGSH